MSDIEVSLTDETRIINNSVSTKLEINNASSKRIEKEELRIQVLPPKIMSVDVTNCIKKGDDSWMPSAGINPEDEPHRINIETKLTRTPEPDNIFIPVKVFLQGSKVWEDSFSLLYEG